MNNFILGTAQFDSAYSLIGNKNSIKENLKILSLAWDMGIRFLDESCFEISMEYISMEYISIGTLAEGWRTEEL